MGKYPSTRCDPSWAIPAHSSRVLTPPHCGDATVFTITGIIRYLSSLVLNRSCSQRDRPVCMRVLHPCGFPWVCSDSGVLPRALPFRLNLTDSSAGYYQDGEPVLSPLLSNYFESCGFRLVHGGKARYPSSFDERYPGEGGWLPPTPVSQRVRKTGTQLRLPTSPCPICARVTRAMPSLAGRTVNCKFLACYRLAVSCDLTAAGSHKSGAKVPHDFT